jgi:hypothetical protein
MDCMLAMVEYAYEGVYMINVECLGLLSRLVSVCI